MTVYVRSQLKGQFSRAGKTHGTIQSQTLNKKQSMELPFIF